MELDEFKFKLSLWSRAVKSPDDLAGLPSLIEDLLSSCPKGGNGCHYWFPKAAYRLARWPFKLPAQEIHDLLEKTALANGRKPKTGEIADAIDFVLGVGSARGPGRIVSVRRRKDKPRLTVDPKLEREACLYREAAEKKLCALSAVRRPWLLSTYEVLRRLFPAGTLLCFNVERNFLSNIYRLSPFFAKGNLPKFIVPNAWVKQTAKGHYRLIGDFDGTWWYQAVEFDRGSLEEQASKILWLMDREGSPRLRMVLWSGNKSFHSWWDVKRMSTSRRQAFFSLAVSIGADPAHQTINQLSRSPNALRCDRQTRQSVIYLL